MKVETPFQNQSRNRVRFRRGAGGHDAYLKLTLNQVGAPEALFKKCLPRHIKMQLRTETVRPADPNLVDRRFGGRYANPLFEADTIQGGTEVLHVPVEHKSYRDPHLAGQLLECIAMIYRRWVNQYARNGQPVPELALKVVYHGTEPWDVPTWLGGLYENQTKTRGVVECVTGLRKSSVDFRSVHRSSTIVQGLRMTEEGHTGP